MRRLLPKSRPSSDAAATAAGTDDDSTFKFPKSAPTPLSETSSCDFGVEIFRLFSGTFIVISPVSVWKIPREMSVELPAGRILFSRIFATNPRRSKPPPSAFGTTS